MALVPLNLLVSHSGRSSRQHITCRHKCGDACSYPPPNTSDNEYFGDVVREALSKLQASGLVEPRHGIGTFVMERQAQAAARQANKAAIISGAVGGIMGIAGALLGAWLSWLLAK